jgi:hypothetical protein
MKKILIIVAVAGVIVAALGVAGYAYAKDRFLQEDPGDPWDPEAWDGEDGFGPGKRSRGGMHGFGMFGGPAGFWPGEDGPVHDYLLPGLAEAFDLTDEQLQILQEANEIVRGIAEEYEPGSEEFQAKMKEALTVAVEKAVEDGALTQKQADLILERIEQMEGIGFGGRLRRMPGMRAVGRRTMGLEGYLGEYYKPAIAEALDVTVEELEAKLDEGVNLKEYAEEQGMSDEELCEMMDGIFTDAIAAALADDAITETQADWLLELYEDGKFAPRFHLDCQGDE